METLKRLWETWKKIAHKIGTFQGKLLLTIFYFTILAPFGLFVKIFQDPLHLKKPVSEQSHWKLRKDDEDSDPLKKARNL